MFYEKSKFYDDVNSWVKLNPNHTFYVYASQTSDNKFYEFCLCVLDNKKIPVIITNVTSWNKPYPNNIKQAMNISEDVRVYESAKVATDLVLRTKANKFIQINGGILWIQ